MSQQRKEVTTPLCLVQDDELWKYEIGVSAKGKDRNRKAQKPPFFGGAGGQKKATTDLVAAAYICWETKKLCQRRKKSF